MTPLSSRPVIRPVVVAALLVSCAAAAAEAQNAPSLTEKENTSYAVGMNLGSAIRRDSANLDLNLIVQGLKDAFSGGATILTEAEMRAILTKLQTELKTRQEAERTQKAAEAKTAAETFLADNKSKEGVVTLDSGLQYKVLKSGEGRRPGLDDTVICHYRGMLIDGTEFDSSYSRGKPATFAVKRVIKGWTEALQRMAVGSKWQLFIPSNLAYGDRSPGGRVPPNATLIFDVELIGIQEATAPAKPGASPGSPSPATPPAVADIKVSFKLDPRLTKGIWLGERWVPAPYTQVGTGRSLVVVEARAQGLDTGGNTVLIRPHWTSSDPTLVQVAPNHGDAVRIAALAAGESSVEVIAGGVSRRFGIKAEYRGDALQVGISEK